MTFMIKLEEYLWTSD